MISDKLGMMIGDNYEDELRKLKESGFDYFSFCGGFSGGMLSRRTEKELYKIREKVKNSKVKLFSVHLLYPIFYPLKDSVEQAVKRNKKLIHQASILGTKLVNAHLCMTSDLKEIPQKIGYKEFNRRSIQVIKELCQFAAQYDIALSLENQGWSPWRWRQKKISFIGSITYLRELIDQVGESNLGICLDTGHAYMCGVHLREAILEAGNLLINTHLNDNFGLYELHLPPGIGTINWLEVIAALDKISYPNPMIFEAGIKIGKPPVPFEDVIHLIRENWKTFVRIYKSVSQDEI